MLALLPLRLRNLLPLIIFKTNQLRQTFMTFKQSGQLKLKSMNAMNTRWIHRMWARSRLFLNAFFFHLLENWIMFSLSYQHKDQFRDVIQEKSSHSPYRTFRHFIDSFWFIIFSHLTLENYPFQMSAPHTLLSISMPAMDCQVYR